MYIFPFPSHFPSSFLPLLFLFIFQLNYPISFKQKPSTNSAYPLLHIFSTFFCVLTFSNITISLASVLFVPPLLFFFFLHIFLFFSSFFYFPYYILSFFFSFPCFIFFFLLPTSYSYFLLPTSYFLSIFFLHTLRHTFLFLFTYFSPLFFLLFFSFLHTFLLHSSSF